MIPQRNDNLSWNVWGLNNPEKAREVREFLSEKNVSLVGLLERKMKEKNLDKFTKTFGKKWSWISNSIGNLKSRILVGW